MKVTKNYIKRLIKEELENVLNEQIDTSGLGAMLAQNISQGEGAKDGENGTFAYNSGYIGLRIRNLMYYIDIQGNRAEVEENLKKRGFKEGFLTISPNQT